MKNRTETLAVKLNLINVWSAQITNPFDSDFKIKLNVRADRMMVVCGVVVQVIRRFVWVMGVAWRVGSVL